MATVLIVEDQAQILGAGSIDKGILSTGGYKSFVAFFLKQLSRQP